MKIAYESKELKKFFKNSGIVIQASGTGGNTLALKNTNTGEEIVLWSESDSGVAAGIPCIFVEAKE